MVSLEMNALLYAHVGDETRRRRARQVARYMHGGIPPLVLNPQQPAVLVIGVKTALKLPECGFKLREYGLKLREYG